jgi:hypothetical protein
MISVCLSVCLSSRIFVFTSVCLSGCPFVCLSDLPLCLFVCLSACLFSFLSVYVSVCFTFYLFSCLCVRFWLSVYIFLIIFVCLSISSFSLSICLFVYPAVNSSVICLFSYQPVHSYVYPSVISCLSVYLSICISVSFSFFPSAVSNLLKICHTYRMIQYLPNPCVFMTIFADAYRLNFVSFDNVGKFEVKLWLHQGCRYR